MSLTAIPNQPITLNDTRLQGCICEGPERCLLVDPSDTLQVQLSGTLCDDAEELLGNPGFTSSADWVYGSWTNGGGSACISASQATGAPPLKLVETSFTPTPGSVYVVYFQVASHDQGTMQVLFGGTTVATVNAAGEYSFVVAAVSTAPLIFQNVSTTLALCLDYASVKELNTDLTVSLLTDPGAVVTATFDYTSDPDLFSYDRDHVTINIPMATLVAGYPVPDGCYTILIESACDGVELTSQCLNVREHECTLLLSACSSSDVGGIYFDNYTHRMRIYGKLVRSTFEYDERRQRLSDGTIEVFYKDRQRVMELRIGRMDWMAHDAVSAFEVQQHFYINEEEYVLDPDPFEPAWGDVWDDQGDVLRKVRPRHELVRMVSCEEDDGGCAPPPNYLVQGTGPNENWVLQSTTNERILIH